MSQLQRPRPAVGSGYTPPQQSLYDQAAYQNQAVEPLTLGNVLRHKWNAPHNRLMKTLSYLPIGQEALAGIAKEVKDYGISNMTGADIRDAALRGIKNDTSYRALSPDTLTGKIGGTIADMVLDPVNLIPIGKVAEVAGKGLKAAGEATGLAAEGEKIIQAMAKHPSISGKLEKGKALQDSIYKQFAPTKRLAAAGLKPIIVLKEKMLGEKNFLRSQQLSEAVAKIIKLVPDATRREFLTTQILDKEPMRGLLPNGQIIKPDRQMRAVWASRVRSLPSNERQAYYTARKALNELEQIKLKNIGHLESMSAEQFSGLINKESGFSYVPRRYANRSHTIRQLTERIAVLKGENPSQIDPALKGLTKKQLAAKAQDVEESLHMVKQMPEALNLTMMDRAIADGKVLEAPSWQQARKHTGRIEDLDQAIQDSLEKDIAKILDIENRDVAKAVAVQNFLRDTLAWATRKGLAFKADQGIKGTSKLAIKGMEDVRVPTPIADEMHAALRSYMDERSVNEVLQFAKKLTQRYKAWTLAPFPGYHMRNAVSGVWQNKLAGMQSQDFAQHYPAAMTMLIDMIKGNLDSEVKGLRGLSRKQIHDLALRHRVLAGGTYAEMESVFEEGVKKGMKPSEILQGLVSTDPSKNYVTRAGFQSGQFIENHQRLAHFMWRLAEGDSPAKAARSVQKYLFDYEHGLSQFEKGVFRDMLVPFYAWTRFNVPLQLEMFAKNTGAFSQADKSFRDWEQMFGGPQPNEVAYQQWLQNVSKVRQRYDPVSKTYRYFFLGNWWPGEEIQKVMAGDRTSSEILNMVTPFLRVPMELLANYNLFQHRKIKRFEGETGKLRIGVPILGALDEKHLSTTATLPVQLEHVLRNVRIINEADRVLGEFNQETGGGIQTGITRTLFGKTYPVNPEKQRKKWAYEINFRIAELSGARSWAKIVENKGNEEKANAEIEKLKALRTELGIHAQAEGE